MNRGINRLPIFKDDEDRKHFTKIVNDYNDICGAKIYHWAWMDNHYHMLAEITYANLRHFVSGIQQSYAQYHHRRHGTSGIFWQGRFKSKPVEIGEYLVRCARYIERNPVRAKIVDDAWDYKWSSASHYVVGRGVKLTDTNIYIGADNWTPHDRQEYAKTLELSDDDKLLKKHNHKGYLGSSSFPAQLKKEGNRYRRRRGRPAKHPIPQQISWQTK